jgi:hypothetical protein
MTTKSTCGRRPNNSSAITVISETSVAGKCAAFGGNDLRGSVAVAAGCPANRAARRTTGIKRFLHEAVGCDN